MYFYFSWSIVLSAQFRDAALHQNDCLRCERHFETKAAFEQHRRDSPYYEIEDAERVKASGIAISEQRSPARTIMSREQLVRTSFGSRSNFTAAYRLKLWDHDNIQQGNTICTHLPHTLLGSLRLPM